jgi:hypothetical protein
LLRAEYLVDAITFTQVQGIPFRAASMEAAILQQIDGSGHDPFGVATAEALSEPKSNGHGGASTNGAQAAGTGAGR